MSTFGRVVETPEAKYPVATVNVPPHAFSRDWEERPKTEVCIGLRPARTCDLEDARRDAANAATDVFPKAIEGEPWFSLWVEHYNDMLLRSIVARGTCDPNDVTQPWEGWRGDPDELARMHLTVEGTQLIFDAWERMRVANDVSQPPASDEDVIALIELLALLENLPRERAIRVRRLLAFCLGELRTVE